MLCHSYIIWIVSQCLWNIIALVPLQQLFGFVQSHVVQFLGACIQPCCMTLVTELMDHSLDKDIYDLSRPFEWEDQ